MSRFRSGFLALALVAAAAAPAVPARAGGDAASGERVFRKCAACHAIGIGAHNRVGPALNGLIGRKAASIADYGYSQAMINAGASGLSWDEATLARFLAHPKGMVEGTRMTFAGLKKEKEIEDVIAYLSAFAADGSSATAGPTDKAAAEAMEKPEFANAADVPLPAHGVFHLGRPATPDEVEAWDIDVRADGLGLPEGRGTVAQGEAIYAENCAVCHGDFGEAVGRWPVLAGGQDSLRAERPEKTIGSYWPYLSTVFDYVRRAMPFGNARGLSDDEVYALTAYLLYLNDVVKDENFELSRENFASVRLPNEENFIADDRGSEAHYAAGREPCMTNCKADPAIITGRARVLDVTPESDDEEGRASVD